MDLCPFLRGGFRCLSHQFIICVVGKELRHNNIDDLARLFPIFLRRPPSHLAPLVFETGSWKY